ncbi:chemotaxis protein [Virgisporangium aliadipatigenens]|uniref:Chemotaxis protein n=1 Tax=Virgisporangium aliadipatigenens TaxID=741659 RepID=A0A8J4DUK9_9ACTN|nr:methyl-accepting chemotaxis protein [Virgisporangium aliadipatigenens]GIJ50919.1 chemotaxis protein [Virgisporangium aliadipatigenens]
MVGLIRRLRLRSRMIYAFGVVCVLLAAVAGVGISGSRWQARLSGQAADLQQLSRTSLELKFDATELFSHVLGYLVNVPYTAKPSDVVADEANRRRVADLQALVNGQSAAARRFAMRPVERAMLDQVVAGLTAMFDTEAAGVSLLKANSVSEAFQVFDDQFYAAFNQTTTYADKLVVAVSQRSDLALAAAEESAARTELMMVLGCALALVLAILLALIVTRSITVPADLVAHAMRRLAERDLTAIPDPGGRDEMAEMSRALRQAVEAVRESMTQVAGRAKALTGSAGDLSALSVHLGENVDSAFERVGEVSVATDEVSANVATMKSAAEQVNLASNEIARSGEDSVTVVGRGVTIVDAASQTVGRVHDASIEIGKIVQTITGIASQTNLLALNATIEAASAGVAGRGFAIVAGEVKELAQGTARATEHITGQISAIQQATTEAIEAMREVSKVVQDISGVQSSVASAVQQQSQMTNEIRRGIGEIAEHSHRIAGNVAGLTSITGSSKHGADSARQSARELAAMAVELEQVVSTFQY